MELNTLQNIFKYSKHFLRNVEPQDLIDLSDFHSSLSRVSLDNLYSFYADIQTETNISRQGDLLCGLYFPLNEPGDTIIITIGTNNFTLTIDNTNKIYLPLNDLFYIPILKLSFMEIHINNNHPFYCIYMFLNNPIRNYLAKNNYELYISNNILRYHYGMAIFKYYPRCFSYLHEIDFLFYSYEMKYYGNVIKRFLKRVKLYRKLHNITHNKHISYFLTGLYT